MIKDSGQRLMTIEDPMHGHGPSQTPLGTVGDNWGWSREVDDGKAGSGTVLNGRDGAISEK